MEAANLRYALFAIGNRDVRIGIEIAATSPAGHANVNPSLPIFDNRFRKRRRHEERIDCRGFECHRGAS
ncbi:hypothetical protein [Burkholderia sp. YIM B11467]